MPRFNLTSIKQNATAETFSLVAVLFLPPTLIASIFGMNFGWMPWLEWENGFWAALARDGGVLGRLVPRLQMAEPAVSAMAEPMIELAAVSKDFTLHNQGGAVLRVMAGAAAGRRGRRVRGADRALRRRQVDADADDLGQLSRGLGADRGRRGGRRGVFAARDPGAAAAHARLCLAVPARRAAGADAGRGRRAAAGAGRARRSRRASVPRRCWPGCASRRRYGSSRPRPSRAASSSG